MTDAPAPLTIYAWVATDADGGRALIAAPVTRRVLVSTDRPEAERMNVQAQRIALEARERGVALGMSLETFHNAVRSPRPAARSTPSPRRRGASSPIDRLTKALSAQVDRRAAWAAFEAWLKEVDGRA